MDTTEKVISAIIIFIVVAIILFYPLNKGWATVKSILGYGEPVIVKNTPADISKAFQDIVSQYQACFNSKEDNCLCDIGSLKFPPGYYISYINNHFIELNKIAEGNVQTSVSKNERSNNINLPAEKNVYCYISYDNGQVKINSPSDLNKDTNINPVYLLLNESIPEVMIRTYLTVPGHLALKYNFVGYKDYHFLNDNTIFFKQGNNICFILKEKLSSDGQDYINKLSKCSPKPLNS